MGYHVKKENRWPNGKIPFEFAEQGTVVSEASRKLVRKVMRHWERMIGDKKVRFVERSQEEAYVLIIEGNTYSSGDIGKPAQGVSKLTVGSQGLLHVLPHELGHIMGLAHENDRNQVLLKDAPPYDPEIGPRLYITYDPTKGDFMAKSRLDQVIKKGKNLETWGRYDIDSLMHYPAMEGQFAWDCGLAKAEEYQADVGGLNRPTLDEVKRDLWLPSIGDILTLRRLYD